MKKYFKAIYQNNNKLYCMDIQEPFIDTRGKLTVKTYYIHECEANNESADWEIIKSTTNKQQAIKYFEALIK
jgi:hypothetical protein